MRLGLVYLILTACSWVIILRLTTEDELNFIISRFTLLMFGISITIIIIGGMLNHISDIHTLLRVQVSEYFNLINIMREGVLVLVREPNYEIRFCNKATRKIFDKNDHDDDKLTIGDLNQPKFIRSTLVKENLVK